jgi:hypothetical protein
MMGKERKVTDIGWLWLSVWLLAGQVTTVVSQPSGLNEVYTITNHVGMVFTDARILSMETNRVLVIGKEGLGVVFQTNLTAGMREDVREILAWRENITTEEGKPSSPKFYRDGILKYWSNKTEPEKIKDLESIIDFCLAERARIEAELARILITTTAAYGAATDQVLVRLKSLVSQRNADLATCERTFGQGQITSKEREQQAQRIQDDYLASYEQVKRQFAREKLRVEARQMTLMHDYNELGALIDTLNRDGYRALRNTNTAAHRTVI